MAYPASLDSFTPKTDAVDDVMAADVNELQTAITAVETELGTDPAGSVTDVKTRLARALGATGNLNFAASTELTISSGEITVTQNFHTIDTASDATTDDLDTINGGAAGLWILVRANHTDRSVVIKHNTGNILTFNGSDITLDNTNKWAFGVYDGDLTKWLIAIPYGTGSSTFLGLSDTPAAFTGSGGYYVKVNAGETALSFVSEIATVQPDVCNGRLTVESGSPVPDYFTPPPSATLYFTPYKGNLIGLYDGAASWTVLSFTELSLDVSGYTNAKCYDIWAYNNSGVVALDSTVWTSDHVRATALTLQDGIYVKTGATTRRYLGTIYINSGTVYDQEDQRKVWNYYNRVQRCIMLESTDAHTYAGTAAREWQGAGGPETISIVNGGVIGLSEDFICLCLKGDQYAVTNDATIWIYLDTPGTEFRRSAVSNWTTGRMTLSSSILTPQDTIGYQIYHVAEMSTDANCVFSAYYLTGYIMA